MNTLQRKSFATTTAATTFTVTLDQPCAAGSTLVIATGGPAVVTARVGSAAGPTFTKRTQSLNNNEMTVSDYAGTAGGETVVHVTLSGSARMSGEIYECVGLGAFQSGATYFSATAGRYPATSTLTLAGPCVVFSALLTTDATANRPWRGLEPVGRLYNNVLYNTNLAVAYGVSDVAAGTYTVGSTKINASSYTQIVAVAYSDTTGVPSNTPYANATVAENSRPPRYYGDWIGATTHANIAGFATAQSVLPGGTVYFKVDSDNVGFNVEVNRLGYYGNPVPGVPDLEDHGAHLMATVAGTPAVQPTPNFTASTFTTDCSNWSVTAQWSVPATARPGVYLVNFRRTDNSAYVSQGMFIVRSPAGSTNRLAVVVDDNTCQAYNNFQDRANPTAGYSLYGQGGTSGQRAYAVSFERPYATQNNLARTWILDDEYSIINFLERNGVDLAYYSSADLDADQNLLISHRAALMPGHQEYVSQGMWDAWEAAKAAGVHMVWLSANSALWHVRFDATRRKMTCYKDSFGDVSDPSGWTGTWRDSRAGNTATRRSESGLHGLWFKVNGVRLDQVTVPDTFKASPFWRSTTVASLGSGASKTLPANGLGYEWDFYRSADPAAPTNKVFLSSTTIAVTGMVANDDGWLYTLSDTLTHNFILWRAASGALVFNAGTNRFGHGLSQFTEGNYLSNKPLDTDVQQALINLLCDMGVTAETRMSVLVDPAPAQAATAYGLTVSTVTGDTAMTAASTVTASGRQLAIGSASIAQASADAATGLVLAIGGGDLSQVAALIASGEVIQIAPAAWRYFEGAAGINSFEGGVS
ncbi:N,N-dimethylformamidase beta subunit family domain-containing protein [Parafrankia sp. EUN1f]|uniref:N,N-dimethylformamidase beta subunit family domain-containing protein n=1 Tax=Parafrankia sp. EUN1f TaxID=102897 RepID=UPI0001C45578|nr:N,N-dimethylformamidase beta subunit family domain-containing protein [Parafrankia sp. EUN1f]EFC86463.1 hypothetical protein FrEUN1fDRAFT_0358 [Parafrankia sp. EUN1f]